MQLTIERSGLKMVVQREDLFRLALQGEIGPNTKLWVGDQETVCSKVKGIRFAPHAATDPQPAVLDLNRDPVPVTRPVPVQGPTKNYGSSGVFADSRSPKGTTTETTESAERPDRGPSRTGDFLGVSFQRYATPVLVRILWLAGLCLPVIWAFCFFVDSQARLAHEQRLADAQTTVENNENTLERLSDKLFQQELTEKEMAEGSAAVARAEATLEKSKRQLERIEKEFVLTLVRSEPGKIVFGLLGLILYVLVLRVVLEHIMLTWQQAQAQKKRR